MKDSEIYTANSTATINQIWLNIVNSDHCSACFKKIGKSDKYQYSKVQDAFICDYCTQLGLRFNE